MPYEITLETPRDIHIFIVREAQFTEAGISFTGRDPSLYPSELQDAFRFFSKDLTAQLTDESVIESLEIAPVDADVPQPNTP